eukprot:429250-Hanusia_phi.AAC.1
METRARQVRHSTTAVHTEDSADRGDGDEEDVSSREDCARRRGRGAVTRAAWRSSRASLYFSLPPRSAELAVDSRTGRRALSPAPSHFGRGCRRNESLHARLRGIRGTSCTGHKQITGQAVRNSFSRMQTPHLARLVCVLAGRIKHTVTARDLEEQGSAAASGPRPLLSA